MSKKIVKYKNQVFEEIMSPKFIKKLEDLAGEVTREEIADGDYYSMFGGNIDDAFYGGVEDGRIELAREILDEIKKND